VQLALNLSWSLVFFAALLNTAPWRWNQV